MKKREKEVLFQLLRDSKLSDREIAKKLNTSQSTITRTRHKLEHRCINSYTIVPNLSKLDINLIAFSFGKCIKPTDKLENQFKDFIEKQPNVIFSGHGEGMGKTAVMISFHKNFSGFTEFMRKTRLLCEFFGENLDTFIVSTDKLVRTLGMANAVEHLVKKE
jgi:DNA-binding Lrp family transcriptional regulator